MANAHHDNDRNNASMRKVYEKAAQLRAERDHALQEMRSGLFCDQCWRTKSEIEKGGENFAQHLQRVNGQAVASPERLAEKEKEYDDRIEQELDNIKDYRQTFQGILKQWTQCRDQSNQAVADYNEAANAARTLEWQEAMAKKQQEYEEWHRKTIELLEEKRHQRELEIEKAKAEAEQRRQDEVDALTRQLEQNQRLVDSLQKGLQAINQLVTPAPATPNEKEAEPVLPPTDLASNDQIVANLGASPPADNNPDLFDKANETLDKVNKVEGDVNTVRKWAENPVGSIKESLSGFVTGSIGNTLWKKYGSPSLDRYVDKEYNSDTPEEHQSIRQMLLSLPAIEHFRDIAKNGIPTPYTRKWWEQMKRSWHNVKHFNDHSIEGLKDSLDQSQEGSETNSEDQ